MNGSTSILAAWQWAEPDQVIATTSVLTVGIVAVAGILAYLQLRHARKELAEAQRPFIVVDIFGSRTSVFRMEVKNIGKTIADVHIVFDPRLTSSLDKPGRSVANIPLLANGIPSLAPGKRHTFVFDSARGRDRTKYPDTYKATVTYAGHDGAPYLDNQVVDLGVYWQTPDVRERDLHDVWNTLDVSREALQGIHEALVQMLPVSDKPFPPLPRTVMYPVKFEPPPRSIEGSPAFPEDPEDPQDG